MQLSCFICLLLFQVRVHLRWQSFVGEKRRLLCWGERGVTGCACQHWAFRRCVPRLRCSCPALPWHAARVNGSWRTPLGTRQAFAWGRFSPFHLWRCILSSPVTAATQLLGARSSSCWQYTELKGCPSVILSTVRSMVWQRTQGCEVCALLSSCISLWQISELEFQIFCTYGCICYI